MDNEDTSAIAPEPAQVAPTTEAPLAPSVPEAPRFDPRRRIRELQSIPERDRTDAEWDELNELEIQSAPGNRIGNQPPAAYAGGNKPGFNPKNRMKSKGGGGKPGGQGGQGGQAGHGGRPQGGRPQQHHNKPRPA